MNLTNFRETPLGRVVEMIRREAQRFGVDIHHSELVGLIPQDALVDAAVWYTQLDQFSSDQILESRINLNVNSPSTDSRPAGEGTSFLDEVAAATAAPGGGSAAAYVGALGAALTTMVAGLTIGRKKYIEVEAEMQAIRVQAEELRKELTDAVEDDSAAFEAVMGTFKLPKATEEQQEARQAAIKIATLNAAHVPLHTVASSVKVMELAGRCARDGNLNAISDAMSGAAMARAALTAAGYNVRINLNSLDDKSAGEKMLKELHELEKKADKIEKEIRKTMEVRGGVT
jgi:glutamate formiminotransferase/formiminotetrahydrofolate cyclodeaminase